jgi:two-component system sensor histidine kinase DegS
MADNMKREWARFALAYRAALHHHLNRGAQASLRAARSLGRQAVTLGLETLDLARLHERALLAAAARKMTATPESLVRRAGAFFAGAVTPIAETHRTAREAHDDLRHMIDTLSRRSRDLTASNRQLKREIVRRLTAEQALRKSERHYGRLLKQSRHMQEQLRDLSRQLLTAQEEERKMISRELHDEIAQTLTGINVRLATLKLEAAANTRGLQKKIASTQRLVEKSVDIVHRFARELRPAVLDDLGLIPALHSFVKSFAKRSRLRINMRVLAGVEKLSSAKRTVLYRVAQEALTNVAKHARATRVQIDIRRSTGSICMEIKDNGKSFPVQRVLQAKGNKRLGLLGMRERVEMVGGTFKVESTSGQGTIVQAQIPYHHILKEHACP